MPETLRLRYQKQCYGNLRLVWLVAAGVNLLLSPAYFLFDATLLRSGGSLEHVRILQGTHVAGVAVSLVVLAYLVASRHRTMVARGDLAVLTFATSSVPLLTGVMAAANQLGSGSTTIFAMGVVFGLTVSIARPWFFGLTVVAPTLLIVIAASVLQNDPAAAASAQVNATVIGALGVVLYLLYDRSRLRDFVTRQELEQLNRFKDTLLHAIGHDLRAPLVHIRRVARVLDDPSGARPPDGALATELDAVSHRFGRMLDNLLAVQPPSRSPSSAPAGPTSLRDVFERAIELNQHDARQKRISLHVRFADDVVVAADSHMLVTIISNLLSNAIKFSPAGATVALQADVGSERVTVRVRDRGEGIRSDVRGKLRQGRPIEPSTGSDGERGLGIGLTVVGTLLETLGAELELRSEAPRGTTAEFSIPRYRGTYPSHIVSHD
jgi:signal transduction histidine kinase